METEPVGMPLSEWLYLEYKVLSEYVLSKEFHDDDLSIYSELKELSRLCRCYSLKERLEKKHSAEFSSPNVYETAYEYTQRLLGEVILRISNY